MPILYKYIGMAAVIASAFGVSWYHGYTIGHDSCRADFDKAQQQADKKAADLLAELDDARQQTREKVRTVYVEKDDTGCADTAIPDGVFRQISGED